MRQTPCSSPASREPAVAVASVRTAIPDPLTLLIAAVSLVLLLRYKAETWWLVAGGAAVGRAGMAPRRVVVSAPTALA